MITKTLLPLAAAASLLAPALASAQSVEVGQLTCRQTDRTNLVLFSEATYSCIFNPVEGASERYTGTVDKIGIDLSTSKVETMVWFVFAPSSPSAGALQGAYYGGSADASLGAGVGARVLVGGFEKSFTLQPAAISGQEGIGIAAGIEEFELKFKQ